MRLDSFFSGALCVMSGGRLPAALFLVFLLDSKDADLQTQNYRKFRGKIRCLSAAGARSRRREQRGREGEHWPPLKREGEGAGPRERWAPLLSPPKGANPEPRRGGFASLGIYLLSLA